MPPQPWEYVAKVVSLGDSGCGKSSLTIRLCEGRFVNSHDVTIGVEFGSRIVPVGPPASHSLGINDPATISPAAAHNSLTSLAKQHSKATGNSKEPQNQQDKKQDKASKQKHMKLSIWDTAGQETYKSITRSYFRGASGALLVFDITRRNTFASVTAWLHDLRQIAEDGIVVILVGNKADLAPSSIVAGAPSGETGSGRESDNKRQVTTAEAEEWCQQNGVMTYVETSAKSGEGVERAFLEVAERIFQNIEAGKYDLNDRRSGVKSAAASGASGRAASKTVDLGVTEGPAWQRGGACCGS